MQKQRAFPLGPAMQFSDRRDGLPIRAEQGRPRSIAMPLSPDAPRL
jgi:hypothetical protein